MKLLHFQIAGGWEGKKNLVAALKINIKPQDPRVFFPWCIAVYYPLWHETLSQRLGLRFTFHKLSVSFECVDREMGVNNGHPQRRLIEDNNTPTLIRTQMSETPTEICVRMLCVLVNTGMLMHTWMWLTHAGIYPHICVIPVCFCLG